MIDWLNDKRRWNDLGHTFFQFTLYTCLPYHGVGNLILCGLTTIGIELFQAAGDPATFLKRDTIKDVATHMAGAFLAFLVIGAYFG